MLGYTADEVGQLIGADMDYCQLIHPEDREAFERFCVRIAASVDMRESFATVKIWNNSLWMLFAEMVRRDIKWRWHIFRQRT